MQKKKENTCCSNPVVRIDVNVLNQNISLIPDAPWITDRVPTRVGPVPQVETRLAFSDILGAWKARWGINRMDYRVTPGLYCVGSPDENSPVLVTANYKMSFDYLRREIKGLHAWILVLDTNGINVWCAAGKGTFGTMELVRKIRENRLDELVRHRTIILPQLGAPGVAAHEVKRQTGFRVVYGPVRAADIKAFLAAGMKATPEMRRVRFGFRDRLALVPMELVAAAKPLLMILGVFMLLQAAGVVNVTWSDLYPFLGAVLAGAVATPALLPWIPGRSFAFKGWLVGFLWAGLVIYLYRQGGHAAGWLTAGGFFLILPAISAYLALNFTGASTFTSLSGVEKEMKYALPAIMVSAGLGAAALAAGVLFAVV